MPTQLIVQSPFRFIAAPEVEPWLPTAKTWCPPPEIPAGIVTETLEVPE